MKNIVVVPYSLDFKNNIMFDLDSKYNNENRLSAPARLRTILIDKGYNINTYDIYKLNEISRNDIYLSFNHNENVFSRVGQKINYTNRILIAQEPMHKNNFVQKTSKKYNKILTWNKNLVDHNQKLKIPAYPITKVKIQWIPLKERRFLTNISINKKSNIKGELYSEREKAIKIAEDIFGNQFDHYGIGWNKPKNFFQKIGLGKYSYFESYKGQLKDKYETLKHYKFSLCFENLNNLPGNISEKIFDCFQCGVIPLYWGAPNVLDYIPGDTFIWREDFKSNKDMLLYLNNMSLTEIENMLNRIKRFLNSSQMDWFWEDNYINRIVEAVDSIAREQN